VITQYRVERLLQRLATDPRTNLLDVQVRIVEQRVFVTGSVESEELRASAEQVVREAVPPEMEVVNNIWVQTYVP
jgi:osmotically-inducible protein OsmY